MTDPPHVPEFVTVEVAAQRHFGARYALISLNSPKIAPRFQAGQFLFLYPGGADDFYLPRPFSPFDVKGDTVSILYQVVGKGTTRMKTLLPGDRLRMLAPLGKPFPLNRDAEGWLLIGGGMGIAPLHMLATHLAGVPGEEREMIVLYGASREDCLVGCDYLNRLGCRVSYATEDGSTGEKGTVLALLEQAHLPEPRILKGWQIVAAGPPQMLHEVSRWGRTFDLAVDLYLEQRMACGVGACLGCVVERSMSKPEEEDAATDRYEPICTNGPVFRSTDVVIADDDSLKNLPPSPERDEGAFETDDECDECTATTIGTLALRNPLIAASGTFGCGKEYRDLVDYRFLGALVTKAVSRDPMPGNPPPRIAEVFGGMLNSIGLQNNGVERFIVEKVPLLGDLDTKVIVNVAGRDEDEYADVIRRLDGRNGIDGFEINISCPNVKEGGALFGSDPKAAHRITSSARKATTLPLIVKLTPNVSDPSSIARAVEEAGCDGISLINTVRGMGVDLRTRKPLLTTVTGGLSGPAIKPVALANLWMIRQATSLPLIGMGGIMNWKDALEFFVTGARAIQIGTVFFVNPYAPKDILTGLKRYLRECGCRSLEDLVGTLRY
jgi:dihydroorotate dehydrogenase (NAD+) catalytic subunit